MNREHPGGGAGHTGDSEECSPSRQGTCDGAGNLLTNHDHNEEYLWI